MSTRHQTDADLVTAVRSGDRAALEVLVRRHHDRVWGICRRISGNDADAADATQEALLTIVRRLDSWDGRAAFTTWLYRVATNACLDELRRRARRPVPTDDAVLSAPSKPDATGSVDARIDVDAALEAIPPEHRAALVLRDLCDMDYAEIATALDIPVGTVKSRIARGRAAVADQLGNRSTSTHRPNP